MVAEINSLIFILFWFLEFSEILKKLNSVCVSFLYTIGLKS